MHANDIFAGPILRRSSPDEVAIWIATTTDLVLDARVRPVGAAEWTGHATVRDRIRLFAGLWVHLLRVVPEKGKFPTGKLLEYSIGVTNAEGITEHASFEAIVAADKLAYPGFTLPTFCLQGTGAKLNALYGSCRKPHGEKGGALDALGYGDSVILNNAKELSTRPAVLCLGGDQIYADDVHPDLFDLLEAMAAKLEKAMPEKLPDGASVPGRDQRQDFMIKTARFTSGDAANHLVTFAEFVAMYGLVLNPRLWPASALPPALEGFRKSLPAVRRLLANTPTYMIFDDHDVTDDWNLSIDWINQVKASPVGSRIISNALTAFWLFQAWGNDPPMDHGFVPKFKAAFEQRHAAPQDLAGLMGVRATLNAWEFATPTVPPIYFLDTRTQRGHQDGFKRSRSGAPAYLKTPDAWMSTLKQLKAIIKVHGKSVPLVLVAAAPIFGYETIDSLQWTASRVTGPYMYDLEGWAANQGHLFTFLLMCGDADVVVLSGDVHYAFTSTATFSVFDGDYIRFAQLKFPGFSFPRTGSGATPTFEHLYASRFLQLNSSALKNYASGLLAHTSTKRASYGHIVDTGFDISEGFWKAPDLYEVKARPVRQQPMPEYELVKVARTDAKPNFVLQQKVNDAGNSSYIPKHNLGLVSILGRRVDNVFLVDGVATSKRSWDFATHGAWEPTI